MTPAHEPPPCVPERPASVRDKCWQRQFVAEHRLFPQPWFAAVTGDRVGPSELGDFLLARPGSYILKPRFGSNGVAKGHSSDRSGDRSTS